MFQQISFGIRLYLRSFVVLSLIGLPIYIPANLFLVYVLESGDDYRTQLWNTLIYQTIIDAFISGVIYSSFPKIAMGNPVRMREAFASGAKNLIPLVATDLIADLITLIGLLLFIIPGIYCLIGFALTNVIVVLEGTAGRPARERSWELTSRYSASILCCTCLIVAINTFLMFAPTIVGEYVEFSGPAWQCIMFAYDCLLDLLHPLWLAIWFSFYWHATGQITAASESQDLPHVGIPEDHSATTA